MGWRFRKSFKIIPGIKLNLNKKSSSITFGGKGAHYTVNSNGKKTKTVGIPGSGIYYTETTGGNRQNNRVPTMAPQSPMQNRNATFNNNGNRKKRGCLFYLLVFLAACFTIALYPLAWIPAIGFIIYFSIKKDYIRNKRRNLIISIAVLISSLILFAFMMAEPNLTSIHAEWEKTTYDVSETTKVTITPTPSDADITSLKISENNVAELDYADGKAVVTFKTAGEASIFFTANGGIDSNTTTITVTDKAAEQAKKEAEEKAARKAEEERIKAEQEEAARKAEEERIKAEQEEAERIAAEQAAQTEAEAQANAQAQQPQEQMVWIPQSGSKYHSDPSCSGMDNPTQVTISEAQAMGYEPCKKCY